MLQLRYLHGPLFDDLKKVGEALKKHITHVEEQIASLEQRGVIVEHRSERLERRRLEREKLEKLLHEQKAEEHVPARVRRKKRGSHGRRGSGVG